MTLSSIAETDCGVHFKIVNLLECADAARRAQPFNEVASTIDQQPSASRALSILHALRESS